MPFPFCRALPSVLLVTSRVLGNSLSQDDSNGYPILLGVHEESVWTAFYPKVFALPQVLKYISEQIVDIRKFEKFPYNENWAEAGLSRGAW